MTTGATRTRDVRAFARFLVVGLLNTGITYALYLLLLQWLGYRTSYTISFVAGIVIAYELNRVFVFQAKRAARSMLAVPLIYALQYVVGLGIVTAAVELLGIPRPYAPILSIAVTVPMTFLLNRWAFTERTP
jgi:putative flippase GtrA